MGNLIYQFLQKLDKKQRCRSADHMFKNFWWRALISLSICSLLSSSPSSDVVHASYLDYSCSVLPVDLQLSIKLGSEEWDERICRRRKERNSATWSSFLQPFLWPPKFGTGRDQIFFDPDSHLNFFVVASWHLIHWILTFEVSASCSLNFHLYLI